MSTAASFRIVPLSLAVAERIRRTRRDDHGNHDLAAITVTESPGAPCRVCLRDAAVGEQVLLLNHSPFDAPHPHRTVGPIYLHLAPCPPFEGGDAVPAMLRQRLLSVRAHAAGGALLDADVVAGDALTALAGRLLADPRIDRLHVHLARPGCFACKIVRS